MSTNIEEFIADLDAGVFAQKMSRALSDVAGNVCDHERKGKVTIEFDISMTSSCQVKVTHTLKLTKPTKRGECTEKDTTQTVMHVNKGGRMTFFPENQDQLFTKTGEVASKEKN